MFREFIEKIEAKQHLTQAEASALMQELLGGRVEEAEIVSLLTALGDKGATLEELVGFASVMRSKARETLEEAGVDVDALRGEAGLLDTCGTGGDGRGTFNVSTAAAIVAAAAGARVAKHGNRSISSRSGSADVLEALSVRLDLPLERIPQCLEEVGLVFLFAPRIHLAMKHVQGARRKLKTKTVFNLLGPLTNPLGATAQLLGVYEPQLAEMMAQALAGLGSRRALVVAGADGTDEVSTVGGTKLCELRDGEVSTREIAPEEFGLSRQSADSLQGGDPSANAALMRDILGGHLGPLRDWVLVNTSAALVAAGRAEGFREGVAMAAEAIDSGRARQKVESLATFTRKCSA